MTGLAAAELDLPAWPGYGLQEDIRPAMRAMLAHGPVAVATIVGLEGGGPRPVGTQIVFSAQGVAGFLSGGCIEADVAIHAAACLADGRPRRLVYGQGSSWPDIRLMCGSRLELLVERLLPGEAAVVALLAAFEARRPTVWTSDGLRRRCEEAPAAPAPGHFQRRFDPAWRLAIVGADPTALAIAHLGQACGYEVLLVRPKGPAEPPPVPGVGYSRQDPAQALAAWGLDAWTAVAVCNHDMELDEAALRVALPSSAPYVGLLGARARLADRLARLRAAGLHEASLGRLRAPIGLKLGGKAPFEIATAVIAEITALRHKVSVATRAVDDHF